MSFSFQIHFLNWSSWKSEEVEWKPTESSRASWMGDRLGWACKEVDSYSLLGGTGERLGGPGNPRGLLLCRNLSQSFLISIFFQENMEIKILCEVLWCFLKFKINSVKAKYYKCWWFTHVGHIEAPRHHCAVSDRLSSLGEMLALGTLVGWKEKTAVHMLWF